MKVKTRWSGFPGGPGYTVMHFRDFSDGDGSGAGVSQELATAAVARVHAFFTSIRVHLPSVVRIDVEPDVDVLEDSTGELMTSYGVTPLLQINGSATGTFSAPSGTVINWRTGGIRNGRKIRGRTFLVPLGASANGPDGNISPATRSAIQTSAAALADPASTPDLGVYARPTVKGAEDGVWSVVTSTSVPSPLAILTSRRD